MARKSRKTVITVEAERPEEAIAYYPTAIYARLSVENSGKDDAGDSIANQISICREYLKGEAELQLYGVYEDNGETGTEFDRPEFRRMMEDVRSGNIKCIIVKDLSRFGRNYLEAGEYLEKIFPFMGVRFISITDAYDSLYSSDAEGALMLPLKNMMNDMYAKDISKKIITSFKARQEKGEFLPPNPPYGYVKSETRQYRYEVDTAVAPYVKLIFEWLDEQVSYSEICKRLTDMGAVTPSQRKLELGKWKSEKYKNSAWCSRTLTDIATNPTYTGCLVFGRKYTSLYQGIKTHRAEADELRILPDMHEAIVSRELFDRVQAMLNKRKRAYKEKRDQSEAARRENVNMLQGKVICGSCKKPFKFARYPDKNGDYSYRYLICSGYGGSRKQSCGGKFRKYDDVCTAVFAAICVQVELALDREKLLKRLKGTRQERDLIDQYNGNYNQALREIQKLTALREGLYENYAEGILTEEEYRFAREKYEEQAKKLQKKLDSAKEKRDGLLQILSGNSEWLKALCRFDTAEGLDQVMMDELVSKVTVYEDCRVDVEMNYADEKRQFEDVLSELSREA